LHKRRLSFSVRLAAISLWLLALAVSVCSQQFTKFERDHAQQMLRDVDADIRKHYYDPKFHGLNWDAKVRQAEENIAKTDSMDGAVSEIAALLDSLNDSHTAFVVPPRNYTHDYGFKLRMIGDRCYVIRVVSASDAEKKGLRPGDAVLAVNDIPVSRKTFWKIRYIYNSLRPQPALQLTVAGHDGTQRKVEVVAKVQVATVMKYKLHQGVNQAVRDWNEDKRLLKARYFEQGDDLLVVKIPEFAFSAEEVDNIVGRMRKRKGVVLDLRGNPGGFVDTLERLLGGMFQNDVRIYDVVRRDSTKPEVANGRHDGAFLGRMVVLVDGGSGSASELFARVIQLEKRGFIMGDRTEGMVMQARFYRHETLVDSQIYYGAEITGADLIMTDGKSLEHLGVDPDIVILPTAEDLASGRDPVMAKAAGLLGVKITPEEAGSMFPYIESILDTRF
jgi:carboxyl-terminal processing protease